MHVRIAVGFNPLCITYSKHCLDHLLIIFVSINMPWVKEDYEWILMWLRCKNTTPGSCSKPVLKKVLTMLDPEKDNELMVSIHNEFCRSYNK